MKQRNKILITGAGGFLGTRLCRHFEKMSEYELIQAHREQPDLSDQEGVLRFFQTVRPDYLIHCAAISDLRACEEDPKGSYQVNVENTRNLARACSSYGVKMIFCSSDQVYLKNGVHTPHQETEALKPPHHYGKQKMEAEELILNHLSDAVCLRLSWMYDFVKLSSWEHDQLYVILQNALKNHETLSFSVHDKRSITCVREVARQMEKTFDLPGGVYNFGSENQYTTYEVVGRMLEIMNADPNVIIKDEIAFSDEPRNLCMDLEKIRKYGIDLQDTLAGFQDAFERFINQ